jgi:hypothetical protein
MRCSYSSSLYEDAEDLVDAEYMWSFVPIAHGTVGRVSERAASPGESAVKFCECHPVRLWSHSKSLVGGRTSSPSLEIVIAKDLPHSASLCARHTSVES